MLLSSSFAATCWRGMDSGCGFAAGFAAGELAVAGLLVVS